MNTTVIAIGAEEFQDDEDFVPSTFGFQYVLINFVSLSLRFPSSRWFLSFMCHTVLRKHALVFHCCLLCYASYSMLSFPRELTSGGSLFQQEHPGWVPALEKDQNWVQQTLWRTSVFLLINDEEPNGDSLHNPTMNFKETQFGTLFCDSELEYVGCNYGTVPKGCVSETWN